MWLLEFIFVANYRLITVYAQVVVYGHEVQASLKAYIYLYNLTFFVFECLKFVKLCWFLGGFNLFLCCLYLILW